MKEIQKTIESLRKNGFEVWYVKNKNEVNEVFFKEIVHSVEPKTISYGDSMTVQSTGIIEELRHSEDISKRQTLPTF